MIKDDPDFQALADFVKERIQTSSGLPTMMNAAQQIHRMAVSNYPDGYAPDYAGGYADAAEDALRAISGIWRHHPDYGGWADDE